MMQTRTKMQKVCTVDGHTEGRTTYRHTTEVKKYNLKPER
jgi:hypothetical protein